MYQIIAPNPNVNCTPGWCLVYVRQTFGVPMALNGSNAKYPTALSNWQSSPTQHKDTEWPALWFPIWFTVNGVPAGHVALHAPDHSIYSSSSPTSSTPVHHPSLASMQQYWGKGTMLGYLGWTEDIEDSKVIGDNMAIIGNNDDWRVRAGKSFQRLRGRDMGEEEFQNYVGQDFLHLVEALEDDPESDNWYNLGTLGRQAQNENWQGQVVTLQKQLNDEKDKDTLDDQKIADLTQQLNDTVNKLNTPVVSPLPSVEQTDASVDVSVIHATAPVKLSDFGEVILKFLKGFLGVK